MPTNKKKKKATNPARGFATTSTVSKSKIIDDTLEDADVVSTPGAGECHAQSPPATEVLINGQNASLDLSQLSPEQLELQLEESELQMLVENFGETSRKDASRQTSKLQTERRLLRSQAERLNSATFLPEELIQLILAQIERHSGIGNKASNSESKRGEKKILLDDLSIKLWTLRRALEGLGFLESSVQAALSHAFRIHRIDSASNMAAGKDSLWGLDQCLDWLALTCKSDEMPDYDSPRTEKPEGHTMNSLNPLHPAEITTPRPATSSSGFLTMAEHESEDENVLQGLESDSDDDDHDPRRALERYITLQRRLYDKNPDLTNIDRRQPRVKALTDSGNSRDTETKRLVRKVKKLEADILFDKDEALERWAEVRIALVKEGVARKRLQLNAQASTRLPHAHIIQATDNSPLVDIEDTKGSSFASSLSSLEAPQEAASTRDLSEREDVHDSVSAVGDFFSSLPDPETNEETGASSMTITTNGEAVAIRDFGAWTGMNPRRVFEEACKARDSSCKVKYVLISSSSFSNRHSVVVRWSKDQDLPVPSPVSEVDCTANHRAVRLDMVRVSTPNAAQSEAYISIAALFVIFITSPKEEKAHVRLPPTWKDLWSEFCTARRETLDSVDRNILRDIRKMIENAEESGFQGTGAAERQKEVSVEGRNGLGYPLPVPLTGTQSPESKTLRATWKEKASTPSYIRMLKSRIALPIWDFRNDLLEAIENNQIVIVCGETGCGKSTQVPAFILEHELSSGRSCKVYCTEPRRISAISLARRVSEELGERKSDVGTSRSLVGYAIRLESHITMETRLVYATTGIVMRMLERGNDLEDITHLVLDEVHERTIDSDFLLIVLRKLMVRRPALKVILMSATVNAEQFSRYLAGAPIMNVPGRTYPVETRYLEDAMEATNYGNESDSSKVYPQQYDDEDNDDSIERSGKSDLATNLQGYSKKTRSTLSQFDEYRIDYELIIRLLEAIATKEAYRDYSKAVLVFLPGIAEIRRLNDTLAGHPTFSNGWYVYPLHSTIATEDQERAFLVPPTGIRKIVLATNIAETGITIPDVTCVVDTGRHKEMRFDERRQLSRLIESFISRANAKQRRGRAGRVQNGLCFHLFTKARHDSLMAEQQTPEMLRLSLQDLVLRVKICKLGGIEQTLAEALDPPLPKNIRRAIDSLIDVKALTTGEDLTSLGRQLAKLPLDVFLGKLILLGSIFKCLDAMLTVAAILSSKSPFFAPIGARAQADLARLAFKRGDSDLLTVYHAYCSWRRTCQTTGSSEYQFCRKNFLSPQTLSNIEDLKAQLTTSLVDAGFLLLDEAGEAALNRARFYSRRRHFVEIPGSYDVNANNDLVLTSVIAWSFYPKLLVRDGKGWRNVANNQSVSLYPTSVNKGVPSPPKWLSFYHIMQSSNKFYNAHETSAAEDFAILLVCGDADFRMYSGVIVIDGNRLRFAVSSWKVMLALKMLRTRIREIMGQSFRSPGGALSSQQQVWLDIWQRIFSQESLLKEKTQAREI